MLLPSGDGDPMSRKKWILADYLVGMSLLIAAFEMGGRGLSEFFSLLILLSLYGAWTGLISRHR